MALDPATPHQVDDAPAEKAGQQDQQATADTTHGSHDDSSARMTGRDGTSTGAFT
jgi:hypothetical protein